MIKQRRMNSLEAAMMKQNRMNSLEAAKQNEQFKSCRCHSPAGCQEPCAPCPAQPTPAARALLLMSPGTCTHKVSQNKLLSAPAAAGLVFPAPPPGLCNSREKLGLITGTLSQALLQELLHACLEQTFIYIYSWDTSCSCSPCCSRKIRREVNVPQGKAVWEWEMNIP